MGLQNHEVYVVSFVVIMVEINIDIVDDYEELYGVVSSWYFEQLLLMRIKFYLQLFDTF